MDFVNIVNIMYFEDFNFLDYLVMVNFVNMDLDNFNFDYLVVVNFLNDNLFTVLLVVYIHLTVLLIVNILLTVPLVVNILLTVLLVVNILLIMVGYVTCLSYFILNIYFYNYN